MNLLTFYRLSHSREMCASVLYTGGFCFLKDQLVTLAKLIIIQPADTVSRMLTFTIRLLDVLLFQQPTLTGC